MNIGKITDAFKKMGLFLLANITGIIFLAGIFFVNYAVYQHSFLWGYVATGVSLIVIALIINAESDGG